MKAINSQSINLLLVEHGRSSIYGNVSGFYGDISVFDLQCSERTTMLQIFNFFFNLLIKKIRNTRWFVSHVYFYCPLLNRFILLVFSWGHVLYVTDGVILATSFYTYYQNGCQSIGVCNVLKFLCILYMEELFV